MHKIFLISEKVEKHLKEDNPNLGAGLLVFCKSTSRFLICKRGPKITHPNQWCILGGMCKKSESAKDGAIREFKEESGYTGQIKNIKPLRVDKKQNLNYKTFIGIVNSEFKPTMLNKVTVDGDVEISDYKWLSLEEYDEFSKASQHFGLKKTLRKRRKIKNYINQYCDGNN